MLVVDGDDTSADHGLRRAGASRVALARGSSLRRSPTALVTFGPVATRGGRSRSQVQDRAPVSFSLPDSLGRGYDASGSLVLSPGYSKRFQFLRTRANARKAVTASPN